MLEFFLSSDAIIALITLTFLEIVLGVDNIVFISILANKLPEKHRKKVTNIGLLLAMVQRIIMLFFVSLLVSLKEPFYSYENDWLSFGLSWQGLILLVGGLFLIYKSTSEIKDKVETPEQGKANTKKKVVHSVQQAIVQILIIDFVFSIDSILTAIGMTNGLSENETYNLILMIIAVVISIVIMIAFANRIRLFIERHPSLQVLGLSFLILIGFMLITEAAHLSHFQIMNKSVGAIPKGYLYFAIAFSLMVEFINQKVKRNKDKTIR